MVKCSKVFQVSEIYCRSLLKFFRKAPWFAPFLRLSDVAAHAVDREESLVCHLHYSVEYGFHNHYNVPVTNINTFFGFAKWNIRNVSPYRAKGILSVCLSRKLTGGWAASLRVGVVASLRVEKWTVIHLEKEKQLGKPCRWTQKKRCPSLWKNMVIGVKNVARRRRKPWAWKYKTMGVENQRNGQRNLCESGRPSCSRTCNTWHAVGVVAKRREN